MDVLDHAREFSPVVQQIMLKSDMTRDYRQLIKITYPSIAEGIENVAGTVPAETSTQTYAEVKSKVFKLYAQPRITNEALMGADINVYQDLITSLGEEIGIYLAAQILYGDGTDLNARGILSSSRVDITDGTGKSWLPTLTPTGVGARPSEQRHQHRSQPKHQYPKQGSSRTGEHQHRSESASATRIYQYRQ